MRRMWLVLASAGACQDLPPATVTIAHVTPTEVDAHVATTLTIYGTFYLVPHLSFLDANDSDVPSQFGVRLGDTALSGIIYEDAATLRATVDPNLTPGIYNVTVTNPQSAAATLHAAVRVLP